MLYMSHLPLDVILNNGVKRDVLLWFKIPQRPSRHGSNMKIHVEMVNLWRKSMSCKSGSHMTNFQQEKLVID